jgi:hypothetical protein
MKRILWLGLLVAFVLVMSTCEEGNGGPGEEATKTRTSTRETTPTSKPNILFILTDDMRTSDLRYMPKTKNLLAGGA